MWGQLKVSMECGPVWNGTITRVESMMGLTGAEGRIDSYGEVAERLISDAASADLHTFMLQLSLSTGIMNALQVLCYKEEQ